VPLSPEVEDEEIRKILANCKKAIEDLHLNQRWQRVSEDDRYKLYKELQNDVVTFCLNKDINATKYLVELKNAFIERNPWAKKASYFLTSDIIPAVAKKEYREWNRMAFICQQYDWKKNEYAISLSKEVGSLEQSAGMVCGAFLHQFVTWNQVGICGEDYKLNPESYPPSEILDVCFTSDNTPRPSGFATFGTVSARVNGSSNKRWRKYFRTFCPIRTNCGTRSDYLKSRISYWTCMKMVLELFDLEDSDQFYNICENHEQWKFHQFFSKLPSKLEKYQISKRGIVGDFLKSAHHFNRDKHFDNATEHLIVNNKKSSVFGNIAGSVGELPCPREKFDFHGAVDKPKLEHLKNILCTIGSEYRSRMSYNSDLEKHAGKFDQNNIQEWFLFQNFDLKSLESCPCSNRAGQLDFHNFYYGGCCEISSLLLTENSLKHVEFEYSSKKRHQFGYEDAYMHDFVQKFKFQGAPTGSKAGFKRPAEKFFTCGPAVSSVNSDTSDDDEPFVGSCSDYLNSAEFVESDPALLETSDAEKFSPACDHKLSCKCSSTSIGVKSSTENGLGSKTSDIIDDVDGDISVSPDNASELDLDADLMFLKAGEFPHYANRDAVLNFRLTQIDESTKKVTGSPPSESDEIDGLCGLYNDMYVTNHRASAIHPIIDGARSYPMLRQKYALYSDEELDRINFDVMCDVLDFVTGYGSMSGGDALNKCHRGTKWNPNLRGLIEGCGMLFGFTPIAQSSTFAYGNIDTSNIVQYLPGYLRPRRGWMSTGSHVHTVPLNLGSYSILNRAPNQILRSYLDRDFFAFEMCGIFYKIYSQYERFPIDPTTDELDLDLYRNFRMQKFDEDVSDEQKLELQNCKADEISYDFYYSGGKSCQLAEYQSLVTNQTPDIDSYIAKIFDFLANDDLVPDFSKYHRRSLELLVFVQGHRLFSTCIQNRVQLRELNASGCIDPLNRGVKILKIIDPELHFATSQQMYLDELSRFYPVYYTDLDLVTELSFKSLIDVSF